MKKIVIAIVFLFWYQAGSSQAWAGPDVNICQGVGSLIGLESAPDDYCYTWTPETGLSSADDKQPFASPDKTTEYTVVAIGPNFSNKVVDKVKVIVYTGGVEFSPSYTEPNAQANQAHAHLTTKPAGASIIWSIEGTTHGCSINSSTGNISYCNSPGEIMVRATLANDPSCFAEEKFRINVGVKQVFAIDIDHPTRKATEGATLHLVGHNNVKFKAVPNSGESFGDDQPDWTGSTVLPMDPHAAEWTHSEGTPLTINITAGGKTVSVERHQPSTVSAGGFSHTMFTLFNYLATKLKPPAEVEDSAPNLSVCKPFSASYVHSVNYEYSPVEKFNSPELGSLHVLEGEMGAEAKGKICFAPPYSSVPNPVFVYSTYLSVTGSAIANFTMAKDESKAVPAKWKANGIVSVQSSIKAGIGGEVAVLVPGDIFGLTGSVFGGTGAQMTVSADADSISFSAKFEPLIIEGAFKVWYLNPNNLVVELKGKYNVMDPIAVKPRRVVDLTQF